MTTLRAQLVQEQNEVICLKNKVVETEANAASQLAQMTADRDTHLRRCQTEKWIRITELEQQLAQVTTERDAAIKGWPYYQEMIQRNSELQWQLAEARAEITVDNKLLTERNRILHALPCPTHGPCVPHVLHWIAEAQARIKELEETPL